MERLSFPEKLWLMVEDRRYKGIIDWNADGTGFLVCDAVQFVTSEILKEYKFKSHDFHSFLRQLSNYGFGKKDASKKTSKAYHHHKGYFKRDKKELLTKVILKKKELKSDVPEDSQVACGQHLSAHNQLNTGFGTTPATATVTTSTQQQTKMTANDSGTGSTCRTSLASQGASASIITPMPTSSTLTIPGNSNLDLEMTANRSGTGSRTSLASQGASASFATPTPMSSTLTIPGNFNLDMEKWMAGQFAQEDPIVPSHLYHSLFLDNGLAMDSLEVMGIGEDLMQSPVDCITDMTPSLSIQEQNVKVPAATITQTSERSETGYSSADMSSQDQDFNRNRSEGPAAAARTSQRRQASFSSEEGSSSQDQELDREAAVAIFPKSGPVKGETPFSLNNLEVDGSVTVLLVTFGTKQVGVTKEHGGNSWLGRTPPGEKPGEVTVVVVAKETGAYLGKTIFTYEPEDEKKTANKQSVSSKRELETYSSLDLLGELTRRIKQAKKDYYSDENGILNSSQQQGMPNRAKLLQLQDIVKSLVYIAAETGARELIEELCSLSAGKIVFEAYKNECPLPENIAEDNGHKEIAAFLKGITKRYSEEDSTNPGQPEDVDWLVLAKAFEDINLIQSDPSSDQDLREIWENISETGYSGDGETSSSNSGRDSCNSDDEYEVCKGSSENDVERLREDDVLRPVNTGGAETESYSDSENERDDSKDQFQAKFSQGDLLSSMRA